MQKLAEAAIVIATQKGMGSIDSCEAAESAIGKAKAAAALLVISSVIMLVVMYSMAKMV